MVINTSIAGTGGTPLAKTNGRPASNSKTSAPSDQPSGATAVNSQINQIFASAGVDIDDAASASASVQFARTHIGQHPATAMLAQANLSPETVLNLLQE